MLIRLVFYGFLFLMPLAPQMAVAKAEAGYSPEAVASWLSSFRKQALAVGVSKAFFDKAFADFKPDPRVIAAINYQPELTRPPGEYVEKLVSDVRIAAGRKLLIEHINLLEKLERLYGVNRYILIAIWGIETNFGNMMGNHEIIQALATLAIGSRRKKFAERELLMLLPVLEKEKLPVDIRGSWAGAMGHMQFIPSTYANYARDVDGDGRRDIWNSLEDSLGSAAYYLQRSGWKTGLIWGFEVVLPKNFDREHYKQNKRLSLEAWNKKGYTHVMGLDARHVLWNKQEMRLILPIKTGPAFLVTGNFAAILKYNHSVLYGLAVGHLADRLRGGKSMTVSWSGTVQAKLTKDEIKTTQQLLNKLGFAAGKADGIVGKKTYQGLHDWQRSVGFDKSDLTQATLRNLSNQALDLSVKEIKILQASLTALDFDAGISDGVLGTKTRNALRDFQKELGLAINGHPDRMILAILESQLKDKKN